MNFNFDWDIVMILALFTIGSVLVIGLVSRMRAKKAQDHHEGAAVERRQRKQHNVPHQKIPPEKMNNPPTPRPPPD